MRILITIDTHSPGFLTIARDTGGGEPGAIRETLELAAGRIIEEWIVGGWRDGGRVFARNGPKQGGESVAEIRFEERAKGAPADD